MFFLKRLKKIKPGIRLGILSIAFQLLLPFLSPAQNLYFVYFRDKEDIEKGRTYLSQEAIIRREKNGILGNDFYDLPVKQVYSDSVSCMVNQLRYRLRWMNAVTVNADEKQIESVKQLEFVLKVEPFDGGILVPAANKKFSQSGDPKKLESLYKMQRNIMNMDSLVAHGLDGRGVRIAILDAGFKEVDTHPAFGKLRSGNLILASKDFYGGRQNPYYGAYHGTEVLGCIAGYYNDKPIGAATGSSFFLARTETIFSEKAIEEDHWFAAMEWADSLGADIISSSLGYTDKRYVYSQMDGHSTRVSNAAAIAVRKGILVVNSIGNEGAGDWHFLGAPADADSVLSVGASFPMIPYPMPFSSFGPNAAGVFKPEISAPGYVISAGRRGAYTLTGGTSFSCPLISGYAACVMQLHPELKNMEIKKAIMQTGNLYPYYDYRMGFGVPDASFLFHERDSVKATFKIIRAMDTLYCILDTLISHNDPSAKQNGTVFYYHIATPDGKLVDFKEYRLPKGVAIVKLPEELMKKGRLRIWYQGYLWEEEF